MIWAEILVAPESPSEEDVVECAATMFSLLYLWDCTDEERAEAVYQHHESLSEELYLEVWTRLDSRMRAGWKYYVNEARRYGKQESQRALISGRQ